ncbi:hypothetical protein B566_EDAN017253 [Ephemera danica]|nr:hypothetical protein B566_EDAN017253 [Ephemera danica]
MERTMAAETTCQKLYDAIRAVDLTAVKDLLSLGGPLICRQSREAVSLERTMAAETTCQKLYDAIRAVDLTAVKDLLSLVELSEASAWPAGDPPLVLAAKTGHEVTLLRELLEHRCPVDASSATGETALHCVAALWEASSVAEAILLSRGADVGLQNDRGETPLLEAMESGALFAAELLLREASSPPSPPLSRSLSVVDEEPNRNSLEQPKIINTGKCINESKNEQPEMNGQPETKIEQPKVNGEQPKTNGHPDINGEQPKVNGDHRTDENNTVLTNSQQENSISKQPAIWLMRSTLYGETALHVAARKDHLSLVELMLRANHEPELTGARDLNGDTALHLAAGRGHVEVVRQLVACADINARNKKGLTPLHVALLLERPTCDVLARTSDERRSSPLDLAQHEYRRRSQPEMSLLLVREAEKRNLPVR